MEQSLGQHKKIGLLLAWQGAQQAEEQRTPPAGELVVNRSQDFKTVSSPNWFKSSHTKLVDERMAIAMDM
jgi:hypothetical protein